MRRALAATLTSLGVFLSTAAAQSPGDSLTPRHPGNGITVLLPASWHPLDDSQRAEVSRITDTLLTNAKDSAIRASMQAGRPITLLQEISPAGASPGVSLNVAPSPGATRTTFDGVSPQDVAEALAQLCPSIGSIVAQMQARLISCDRAVTDQADGHTLAVTHLVRSGPTGFVTMWLAQYPDKDVVYTLTLSAPQAEEARYQPLFQQIWRSFTIDGS